MPPFTVVALNRVSHFEEFHALRPRIQFSQVLALSLQSQLPVSSSTQFEQAFKSGRASLHALNICPQIAGVFANCYGYTGAHCDSRAAGDFEHVFQAVVAELLCQVRGPKAIVGDINADLPDIPVLGDLIQNHGWIDLGHHASLWGGLDDEFTCLAHISRVRTRRDYILVSPEMFSLIDQFQVVHHDWFPVHSMLHIRFVSRPVIDRILFNPRPRSLYDAFMSKAQQLFVAADDQTNTRLGDEGAEVTYDSSGAPRKFLADCRAKLLRTLQGAWMDVRPMSGPFFLQMLPAGVPAS